MLHQLVLIQCIQRIASWQLSETSLQLYHADYGMAIGAYNDSIFIIGGIFNPNQLTQYRWKSTSNALLNLGNNVLSVDVWGYGQFWVQNNHILYLIQPDKPNHLVTYNMASNQFIANTIQIPIDVDMDGCLALSDQSLYVVGGLDDSTHDNVQVFNKTSYQWISNAPSMNEARGASACTVYNDYLWAFAGWNGYAIQTNERINIINISQNNWEYVDPLTFPLFALRCVSWMDTIYLIGGRGDSDGYQDVVYMMDANTGTITQSVDRTPHPTAYSSPIIVDGTIYLFGGISTGKLSNEWMYYTLSTKNPTTNPTMNPTMNTQPSIQPSTIEPSAAIHSSTSNINTTYQDGIPSKTPTDDPSFDRTMYPSKYTTTTSTATVLNMTVFTSSTTNKPNEDSAHSLLILFIAGIIASCCFCCCCVIIIWKFVTQKPWHPKPHTTAGSKGIDRAQQNDAPYLADRIDEEPGLQLSERKRVSSLSLGNVVTIEGPPIQLHDSEFTIEGPPNQLEEGEFIITENINIDALENVNSNVEGIQNNTNTTRITTNTMTTSMNDE